MCVQVRLLTGIGRFYEMAYIPQLLMENDQFESLLHTGLDVLHTHHTVHFTLSCIPICMCVWLTVCLKMTTFSTYTVGDVRSIQAPYDV